MNPQSSSTFSQVPNLESAMVVKFCSQSMIARFRMSQSTMNLARQDSGEVSNKAENAKRTKIQIVLTHLWFESSVTKVQNVLGAGHAFFDKNTCLCVFAKQSPQMDTNICHPTSQKSWCAFNCKISNWCDSILPSGPNNAATMEERALCIYGFRVVLRFCRQLFSSVKYFCGFLQLFTSFQYFIFIVQISFTNENLYISAGTKEEIVRTKVENKLQWVHLSFILEISFVLIIIQQHDSASVLFLSLSRACNLPSHVFRQLVRPIQVREGQR